MSMIIKYKVFGVVTEKRIKGNVDMHHDEGFSHFTVKNEKGVWKLVFIIPTNNVFSVDVFEEIKQ
jgi:hypothetical protein